MQEIVTLACEKWAAGDKVTTWQIIQFVIFLWRGFIDIFSPQVRGTTRSAQTRLQQI